MRILKKLYIVVLMSWIVVSCEETDFSSIEEPIFHTAKVGLIDSNGVQLHAFVSALGSETIVDHGFQWDIGDENFSFSTSLGSLTQEGEYSYLLNSGIREDRDYSFRAYVETGNGILLVSNVESFNTRNSDLLGQGPEIISFSPNKGTIGSEVTLVGTRFSILRDENVLELDDQIIEVIASSDTTIQARISSQEINFGNHAFRLITPNGLTRSQDSFCIQGPIFNEIIPSTANPGQEVSIIGELFSPYSISIVFREVGNTTNNQIIRIFEKSDSTLTLPVPQLQSGEYAIFSSSPNGERDTQLRLTIL